MLLNETLVRGQFPALERDVIFFDNPGGTQIARPAVERIDRLPLSSHRQPRRGFRYQHRVGRIA